MSVLETGWRSFEDLQPYHYLTSKKEGDRMSVTKEIEITKVWEEKLEEIEDTVVVEYPLTIFINEEEFITLLCSPRALDYLVVGFLASEGIIKDKKQIKSLQIDSEKGHAYIELTNFSSFSDKLFGKRTVTTGCGKGTVFYNVLDSLAANINEDTLTITAEGVLKLIREFNQSSDTFKDTGGVHSCSLCDANGMLIFQEDIGRHNALDKIIGEAQYKNIVLKDKILLTSGRISSEMIIKASKHNIPIIISRSAATELSINIAKELNITLIGFARGKRMNIYNGKNRVLFSKE